MFGLDQLAGGAPCSGCTIVTRRRSITNGFSLHHCDAAGAAFSSYTTTGSFSRSAVNNSSGAKTQLAGFVTAMVVMFVLLFMTKVFSLLPYNTMAAIIIAGVSTLVEFDTAIYLFKVSQACCA